MEKNSSLYDNILYVVVPKDHDLSNGVYPEDQKLNSRYVLLWGSDYSLTLFDPEEFKLVAIKLPQEVRYQSLRKLPGDAYALPFVSSKWFLEEVGFLDDFESR